jgi:hypothetical protein
MRRGDPVKASSIASRTVDLPAAFGPAMIVIGVESFRSSARRPRKFEIRIRSSFIALESGWLHRCPARHLPAAAYVPDDVPMHIDRVDEASRRFLEIDEHRNDRRFKPFRALRDFVDGHHRRASSPLPRIGQIS